jgi:DNA-binding beta-propeller fold protein YncE
VVVAAAHQRELAFAGAATGAPPTNSSPVAISHDNATLWVVNPENDSVSALRVKNDVFAKVREVPVVREPRCVAITPDDRKIYVTCMAPGASWCSTGGRAGWAGS